MTAQRILIVGAGQAGLQIADSLRKEGFEGHITLCGDEFSLPYQRPPLSKKYLQGAVDDSRLLLRPVSYYQKTSIDVRTDVEIASINLDDGIATARDGAEISFDKLALTTGASVRKLPVPGADHQRVMYLRGVDDAQAIKAALEKIESVVVIGGGFIGLEFAAIARGMGKSVAVIEAQSRLMERAVSAEISKFYRELHERNGVRFIFEDGVAEIEANADADAVAVKTTRGESLDADLVVVGIGVIPNTDLASSLGLEVDGGIVVDEFARTSDPRVVAAGDCTMHRNVRFTAHHRLESVQNAIDQAKIAATSLLGESVPYAETPWFWSDQYETKLQMVGIGSGHDEAVIRGDKNSGAFSVFYFRAGEFIAVDSVNSPLEHMLARKIFAKNLGLTPAQAADESFDLKAYAA